MKSNLFTVSIENSLNSGFTTEKLWHPLTAGSMPIYLGAPNFEDWLPCKTACIIKLSKFESPKYAQLFFKILVVTVLILNFTLFQIESRVPKESLEYLLMRGRVQFY